MLSVGVVDSAGSRRETLFIGGGIISFLLPPEFLGGCFMLKRIVALLAALFCGFVLSVAAFAALPTPSYDTTIVGSKAITTDTLISVIYQVEHQFMIDNDYDADQIAAHTPESVAALYTCTSLVEQYAVVATENKEYENAVCRAGFMAWYDADGNLCVDSYSRSGAAARSYYRSGSSGGSGGGSTVVPSGNTSVDSLFTSIIAAGTSFLSFLGTLFSFLVTNPLSLIFLGVFFVGIGIYYVRRIVGAFGRGR